jgi:acetyl-CoA carboxylase biotin carboxylase subunit
VVEESPSPVVSPALRTALTEAAAAVARGVGYTNAGTIEFLLDEDGSYYFLEMNTRLQVEHPITEAVTGVDLVQWQIRIARGERLTLDPARLVQPNGHAIECRVYAEDPEAGFMPSPGRIAGLSVPHGPGIRDDSGVSEGDEVPIFYDPLISKLIAWGEDRPHALARMGRALAEYDVRGIKTTIPFFKRLLDDEDFRSARFDTTFVDRHLAAEHAATASSDLEVVAAIAVAVHHWMHAQAAPAGNGRVSRWRDAGRAEALGSSWT